MPLRAGICGQARIKKRPPDAAVLCCCWSLLFCCCFWPGGWTPAHGTLLVLLPLLVAPKLAHNYTGHLPGSSTSAGSSSSQPSGFLASSSGISLHENDLCQHLVNDQRTKSFTQALTRASCAGQAQRHGEQLSSPASSPHIGASSSQSAGFLASGSGILWAGVAGVHQSGTGPVCGLPASAQVAPLQRASRPITEAQHRGSSQLKAAAAAGAPTKAVGKQEFHPT